MEDFQINFLPLKIYCNLQKLKINDDKMNLMLLNNEDTTLTNIIIRKEKFIILGCTMNDRWPTQIISIEMHQKPSENT